MYSDLPYELKLLILDYLTEVDFIKLAKCLPKSKLLDTYILKRLAVIYLELRGHPCMECYDSDDEENEYIYSNNPFLNDEQYSYFHKFSGNNDVLRLHTLISYNVKPIIIYTIFYLNWTISCCSHSYSRGDIVTYICFDKILDEAKKILSRCEMYQIICIGISLLGLSINLLDNYRNFRDTYKKYFPDKDFYELFISERYLHMDGAKLHFTDIIADTVYFLRHINGNIYDRETKKILHKKILKIAEEKDILPELITGLMRQK